MCIYLVWFQVAYGDARTSVGTIVLEFCPDHCLMARGQEEEKNNKRFHFACTSLIISSFSQVCFVRSLTHC